MGVGHTLLVCVALLIDCFVVVVVGEWIDWRWAHTAEHIEREGQDFNKSATLMACLE